MDDGAGESRVFAAFGALASVVAHAGLVSVLWRAPEVRATPRLPARVELSVTPARVEPPPATPAPAEPEPSVRVPRQAAASRQAPRAPRSEPERAPAESEPAPIDLSGITLTNEGAGASWSSQGGNGRARSGPIRAGHEVAASQQDAGKAGNGTGVVPLGSLSRRPAPPALDGLLRSYYPSDARRLALGGVAVVRARIAASGRVQSAWIASESRSGFGAACRKTLLGSRWTPPLDQSGRAVMTDVSYTCRFRVDD